MQILVHDDVRIDARIDGSSRDTVLLIHGFPLSKEIWEAQIPVLARAHRVIAVDLRGMGSSSVPPGPYLMEALAGDVAAVLDHLGVERVAMVGHSLGGYVALAFARMYGERIATLALVCSRIAADSDARREARFETARQLDARGIDAAFVEQSIEGAFLAENREKMSEAVEKARKIIEKSNARGLASMLRGMALRDGAEDIAPELNMPVLVVAGRRDPVVPLAESEAATAAFPGGRLVVLDRTGHLPMLEEPDRLAEVLAEFIAG
ncbi:MAG TPA: alpha/beta hydrolase [Candidatus Aquilonibacter sp.]|nr:alpha/beta hydrolase [Candidatus Aquilonibacter sp.]